MSDEIFEALDEGENKADNGGDFADWWEPEQPGDQLVGVIVELHSEPRDWTEAGEVPNTVRTVMSVGRGDFEAGQALTPKQHKQLMTGLEHAEIGDMVQLEFTGYEKVEGRGTPMNTYEVKVLEREAWEELGGADDIEGLLGDYTGVSGDNRRTTPYEADDDGSTGASDDGVQADDSEIGQAAAALRELVDIQGGEVEREQAERILTDIRGFDVDMDEALLVAGLDEDDGVISG